MTDAPPPTGPPTTPADGPVVRPLLDVGSWLTDTTRTLVHGFGEFFAVLTVVSFVAAGVATPLLWSGSRTAVLRRSDGGGFDAVENLSDGQASMIAVAIVVLLAGMLLLFAAATVHIDGVRRQERPRWQASLATGVRRAPRVIGVVVQVLLIALVLAIVVGAIALLVPGLAIVAGPLSLAAAVWLWVRAAVAATHAALASPGSGLVASFAWTRGRVWPLLGRHILLVSILIGILLISSFVAAPFQSLGGATATSDDVVMADMVGSSVPAFAARQLIGSLASGLATAIWASGMLSLYRSEPPSI